MKNNYIASKDKFNLDSSKIREEFLKIFTEERIQLNREEQELLYKHYQKGYQDAVANLNTLYKQFILNKQPDDHPQLTEYIVPNKFSYLARAKRLDNHEWEYGFIVYSKSGDKQDCFIVPPYASDLYAIKVDPNTICHYTQISDNNGKNIFEDDIVKTCLGNVGRIVFGHFWDAEFEVEFYGFGWAGKDSADEDVILQLTPAWKGAEVIGNIYDNPELLPSSNEVNT